MPRVVAGQRARSSRITGRMLSALGAALTSVSAARGVSITERFARRLARCPGCHAAELRVTFVNVRNDLPAAIPSAYLARSAAPDAVHPCASAHACTSAVAHLCPPARSTRNVWTARALSDG